MRRKMSFLLILILMAGVFAAGCGGEPDTSSPSGASVPPSSSDASLSNITEKGVLVIGCDDTFAPMEFRDIDGRVVGFDIDLANAVADYIGVELEVKAIDWRTKELELSNGNIDVIWNGYTITAERNKQVEFTKPYLKNEQVIVVRADSDIKAKADLAGLVIGCQVESAAEAAIRADDMFFSSLAELKIYDEYQDASLAELRTYDEYQNALMDLSVSNRIAAVAVDRVLINYIMTQQPDTYRVLDETLTAEYYGIGCPKDAVALREAIDGALDVLQQNGAVEGIADKWFGENIVIRDIDKLSQQDIENLENR